MKKITSFGRALRISAGAVLAAVLIFNGGQPPKMYAYDIPNELRIGLTEQYQNVGAVPVENQSVAAGYELGGQFFESAVISANSGFSARRAEAFYIRLSETYTDYESARAAAVAMPLAAAPCLLGIGEWAVYIGGYQTDAAAAVDAGQLSAVIVATCGNAVALLDGDLPVMIFDNPGSYPQLSPADDDTIALGGRTYRGRIELGRYTGGALTAVNVLSPDDYLYSAVPSEMPSGWPAEALKSQAVAARNYAVVNREKHGGEGFGLCDGIHCQVYLGAGNEAESTTRAVNETSGELILYEGEPIDAVFFSSSGGATDDGGNVWANDVPYLKSVREINEPEAKIWTRMIPLSELDGVLAAHNENIGAATGLYIAALNDAGRVAELVITGTNGQKSLVKDEIRTYFSSLPGGSLESRLFTVSTGAFAPLDDLAVTNGTETIPVAEMTAVDGQNALFPVGGDPVAVIGSGGVSLYSSAGGAQNNGTDIMLTGRGWGHGVGMSQYGARGMAEMGYTYDQILTHYYQGVTIE